MKYVVRCDSEFAQLYAQLVIKEIDRFDYRATFLFLVKKTRSENELELRGELVFSEGWKSVKSFQPDAYLDFSMLPDLKLVRKITRIGALTYYFQITENYRQNSKTLERALHYFHNVRCDLPLYPKHMKSKFSGHFLTDMIRRYNISSEVEAQEDSLMRVAFLCATAADERLVKKLSAHLKSEKVILPIYSVNVGDAESAFMENLAVLRAANAAIVTNDFDEMLCAFVSCPALRIQKSNGWFSIDEYSIIGSLLDQSQKALSRDLRQIVTKLNVLLSDHQSCANRLTEYQKALDIVGNNPVIRALSQEITEDLENRN